jgi:hypothetical protein
MDDANKALRLELTRLQRERDRLESEVNLWRTRYFELVAHSLGTKDGRAPEDPGGVEVRGTVVSSNPTQFLAKAKSSVVA